MLLELQEIGKVNCACCLRTFGGWAVSGDYAMVMYENKSPNELCIMSDQIVQISDVAYPVYEWVEDKPAKWSWWKRLFFDDETSGHYVKVKEVQCRKIIMSNNMSFYVKETLDQLKSFLSDDKKKLICG